MDGLIHVSELSWKHVDHPGSVVAVGDEVTVQVLDVDLDRERISLSIKQAAEGGVVAAEYQEHFGEHQYDNEGNYIGPALEHSEEAEEAWAEYFEETGGEIPAPAEAAPASEATEVPEAAEPAADPEQEQ
jgi:small subunit ribosomal protein S1